MRESWDERGNRLAARAIADGEPTAWFDQLYQDGVAGSVDMPWDRSVPNPLLADWAAGLDRHGPDLHGPDLHGPDLHGPDLHGPDQGGPDRGGPERRESVRDDPEVREAAARDRAAADEPGSGTGSSGWSGSDTMSVRSGVRAVVVGCGLGADAEFLSGLGFATTAFDVAPTAVEVARGRHPASTVDYRVADLFAPPDGWVRGSDLVVDVFTVQSLPEELHREAIVAVGRLVAPAGRLLVIAFRGDIGRAGPPWPLTEDEINGFATGGLSVVSVERPDRRWKAEFRRE